jgi:hypothetical protein
MSFFSHAAFGEQVDPDPDDEDETLISINDIYSATRPNFNGGGQFVFTAITTLYEAFTDLQHPATPTPMPPADLEQ